MANLYRLILALLALVSTSADAASYYKWRVQVNPIASQPWFAEALDSCKQGFPTTTNVVLQDNGTVANCRNAAGGQLGQSLRVTQSLTCTAPAVATFESSGTINGNWNCVTPNPVATYCTQTAGSPVVDYAYRTTTPSLGSKAVCTESIYAGQSQGCADQVEVTFCAGSSSGVYTCYGSGKRTGGTCTLSTQPEATTSTTSLTPTVWPEAPPKGKCPGQVNGVDVLVDCATTSSSSTLTGTTTTGSGTSATSVTAGTTTNTVCSGGLCTVSVVVSGPAGTSQVNVTSGTQSQICANSTAEACQGSEDSSSFGGSCAAGFSCDGDAVQCAMAKEQHTKNCQLFEGTSPERSLYEAAKSSTTAGFNSSTTAITPGSFDTTNALGAGSCIADLSVVVWGSTIELPFSQVCDSLQYLRAVLLAVSFLIALRIVTRG